MDAFSLPLLCPKFCQQLLEEVTHFRDWREGAKQISPGWIWAIWEKVCDLMVRCTVYYIVYCILIAWYGFEFILHLCTVSFYVSVDTPKSKITTESHISLQIVDDMMVYAVSHGSQVDILCCCCVEFLKQIAQGSS